MNWNLKVQRVLFLTIFFFIFIALSITVKSIPPVTQETLIVDINGNGDYISIKEAVNNAKPTDIIHIKEGVYKENNLEINKKITIIGDNPDTTIINCEEKNGFMFSSTYVDIKNIQLTDTKEYAIYVPFESNSCSISNCIINKDTAGVGILVRANSVIISNCDLRGYNKTAIGIQLQEYNNIIQECTIQRFDVGILVILNAHDNKILDSNLLDNEKAVDIRINSNNNLVTNCNIYSNKIGVHIWQSSNDNLIFHNNLRKNDEDAKDESNNQWDNGNVGNYWDDYIGIDNDGNSIGDTPFIISAENADRFPIVNMILPDFISIPTNVKHDSSVSDNTPSFTWEPSFYNKGVKGYYVRIDSNPEIYIGNDITSWTSPVIISEGIHSFYVGAKGTDDTNSSYASITFSIDTIFIDNDQDGWSNEEEQRYGTNPNDPDNYPLDTDNDHIPNPVDSDDDNDGYSDDMERSYGTDTVNLNSYPIDTDEDYLPDDDSPDGIYTGDIDDDNDGLIDIFEINLGSNLLDETDVIKIYIDGKPYYLVDISKSGQYDIIYEPSRKSTTAVEIYDENYLIDLNRDGSWDYMYYVLDGTVSEYAEIVLPWTFVTGILSILVILFIISIIVIYYIRIRPIKYIFYKEAKKPVEKRMIKKPFKFYADDKDTIKMISQTKYLLQNIQRDVTVYMDKLHQIEDQIEITLAEDEEASTSLEKYTSKPTNNVDIEKEIDELLSRFSKDDKQQ
jgi:parallel beta-helix repeat protein